MFPHWCIGLVVAAKVFVASSLFLGWSCSPDAQILSNSELVFSETGCQPMLESLAYTALNE